MFRVLIIESNHQVATLLKMHLQALGAYQVTISISHQEALCAISYEPPDLVMMGVTAPYDETISLVRTIKVKVPKSKVIMMTLFDSEHLYIDQHAWLYDAHITKGSRMAKVNALITRLLTL